MPKRTFSELLDGQEDDGEVSTSQQKRRHVSSQPAILALPQLAPSPPGPPPPFQQPVQLLSFSYTSQDNGDQARTRVQEWNDKALRYYVPPPSGADLGHGFARWVRRAEERPRLDGLLAACMRDECKAARAAAGVVSWRGVVTKILTAPYETREGWSLNLMRVGGTLYVEEHLTEEQLREKTELAGDHRLMTYYGYAFESYCTTDVPPPPPERRGAQSAGGWGGDVDTNVQWCSVVKTKLANVRLLLGGEVDCVRDRYTGQPDTYVELKTSLALRPGNRNDAAKFEKKLLKFHIQSFLLGVPEIVVGFRTPAGRLQSVQSFRTLDLPRLVRGKRDAWDATVCLTWGARVIEFINKTMEADGDEREHAVWRATFTPGKGLTVVRLDAAGEADVRGGEERVGFLPEWYWNEVSSARRDNDAIADGMGSSSVNGKHDTLPGTQVQGWQI